MVFAFPLGSQNVPKSIQELPKSVFFSSSLSTSILVRFWYHLGSQNASLWASFRCQRRPQNFISKQDGHKNVPRRPQGVPKMLPGGSGTRQDAPKRSPGLPKRTQELPKMLSRAPKRIFHNVIFQGRLAPPMNYVFFFSYESFPSRIQNRMKRFQVSFLVLFRF